MIKFYVLWISLGLPPVAFSLLSLGTIFSLRFAISFAWLWTTARMGFFVTASDRLYQLENKTISFN